MSDMQEQQREIFERIKGYIETHSLETAKSEILKLTGRDMILLLRQIVKECCALSNEWEDIIKHEGVVPTSADHIRSNLAWLPNGNS